MDEKEELSIKLSKLLVRLNLQDGKQLGTMVQILQDLLFLSHTKHCAELFGDQNVHVLLLLKCGDSTSLEVQQGLFEWFKREMVGWSLLCRLMEICPQTLERLARPIDYEFLDVHKQILKVLSLHQNDAKMTMVGLRALALLLSSGEIVKQVLQEEEDVFSLVLEAMRSFREREEVQLQGCTALQPLLHTVSENQLVELVEKKDHEVILDALRRFMDSEAVVLQALKVLLPLSSSASNVEILMSKAVKCYMLTCQAMNLWLESEAIQEAGCCLLSRFTSETYYNILVLNGVHTVAVKACVSYPENAAVQTAALSCLSALAESIVENEALGEEWNEGVQTQQKKAPHAEEMLIWREACYTALVRHAEDVSVQEAACWALNSLLLHCNISNHVELEGRPPLHTLIMAAMLLHSSSVKVFRAASCALHTLIQCFSRMRSLLLSHGIHFNIVELMRKHSDSSVVCESACRLLHMLFQGARADLDEAALMLGQILTALKTHNFLPEVQLEGLRASLVLLSPDRSLREHGISVADPDTVDVSLRVLKNQCVLEGAHTVYLEALNRGAIDTVLHTLQMFPEAREIHRWALSLLFQLICRKKLSRMMVPVLASVLVASVRQHRGDTALLLKGLQVVWKLLDTCSSAAVWLQKEGIEKEIFQILREKPTDLRRDPLQGVSCLCLSKLVSDASISYALLERACEDGDVDMAECLITLGADINNKSGSDSLIYQVCDQAAPLALLELLVSSGVQEQQLRGALSVCVRREDDAAVTLILGRLGLDRINSALCLGSFRLARMKAAWISALLSERGRLSSVRDSSSKGRCLARQISWLQRKKGIVGVSRLPSDVSTSGYLTDEESDDSHVSLEDSLAFMFEDLESDGSDGTLNGSVFSDSPEVSRRPSWRLGSRRRRGSSEINHDETEPSVPLHQRLSSHSSRAQGNSEGSSPLALEPIRLLDLSKNELTHLSCLIDLESLRKPLENLHRLDLSFNSLSEFPRILCQSLRGLTRLDLQGNQLQSLPAELLGLPALSALNVSQNCIGPLLLLDPGVRSPSLRQLNLSFNQITVFPFQISQAMSRLEELSLEGNHISELSLPLALAELKHLDISKNQVGVITDGFLSECLRMETFIASANQICSLSHLPSKVTTVKLSQNSFTQVPDVILGLPYLRSVDMRNNQISVLPAPSFWSSENLRELIFCHNLIFALNLSGSEKSWNRLEKLHLSFNKLTEIPPQIGALENLTSLDISHNEAVSSFPDEMGKLVHLWDLPLDGLQLQMDLKHIGSKTKDIIRFLHQRLKKAMPYLRMKLLVVGSESSGKSSLIQQLMRTRRAPESRSELLQVRDWPIRGKDKRNMLLNVWELSGGEECSGFHPHFMSSRALYLVLYDLSKGAGEIDAIKPWLFHIKALAAQCPVMLVGTHADVCEEQQLQDCELKLQTELLSLRGFPAIRGSHMVCASVENESISSLRKAIVREISTFKIQAQPVMGQLVPDCYIELQRRFLQERARVPEEFPVLRHSRLMEILQETKMEEGELPHAIHFLSEAGRTLPLAPVWFTAQPAVTSSCAASLWQTLALRCTGSWNGTRGVVPRCSIQKFLERTGCFPREHRRQFFRLLEKFQIALPFGDDQLLMPSRPVIELPHCEHSELIVRLYEMPYFPMGFWSRLISRLLEVSAFLLHGREKGSKPNRIYWRKGIYLNWSAEAYCLVEALVLPENPASFIKITVPCSRKGRVLFGQVVDHFDSLLEEWFPGLLATDVHGSGETLLKKWAVFSFSDGQDCQKMLLEDLLSNINADGLLVNPEDSSCTLPISQISPDLALSDQPSSTILDAEQLEMELSSEYLLGDGGFGSVYKAVYKNEEVAVKIFNKHASALYVHRLMRQELVVLGRLCHSSLVRLLAAGSNPYLLVMELAPCGSLDSLFEKENGGLSSKLQHRIALHVADGLRYLHSSMIIYRDLKPHNILLFSLKTDAEVIAKITDYGIVQYCCSMGVCSSEGTPGFRAPEVARGNVIYNVQADVFSFGLLMYDLLTYGERISDGLKFPSEFDEAAVQGKLPDPVKNYGASPWPEFESLMNECLRGNPQERPTSAQVFERLSSAEVLCLQRELTVTGFPGECLAVSGAGPEGKRSRVWVGGGSSSQKHGSVASVEVESGEMFSQLIDSSPILCMVIIRAPDSSSDWLVAGSQSGSLFILDTGNSELLHQIRSVRDSVTSLYFHTELQHRCVKSYLLVGTADGTLVIYEDSALKVQNGEPVKTLQVGEMNTPLMCLGPSSHPLERRALWAACGSRVILLTVEYDISRSIDTKPKPLFQQPGRGSSEACISRLAVDKHVLSSSRKPKAQSVEESVEMQAGVKALLVQHSGTLWIATRAGHVLLVDVSSSQLLQSVSPHSRSIRCMGSALIETLNRKNVILILGRRLHLTQDQIKRQSAEDSVLTLWSGSLPLEARDLMRHCELRRRTTSRMRETLHT
ncbi:hypothetical protein DNTS_011896 [Danionella cerebrum]|uniref:non-specific serine/threonine protein kinase n=1 Tax=Danionella cerebrum TaxID=2873325 RepID=A0A553Q7H7_9TELE|nr:hypothetical protein DNTS_011896 [Danionella translucida]